MKNPILKLYCLTGICLALALFITGCTDSPTSSTETTNGDVYGVIKKDNGEPVKEVPVYMRSANYTALPKGMAAKSAIEDSFTDTALTNGQGEFRFTLEEADSGALVIEAVSNPLGVRESFTKAPDEPLNLGELTMDSTGTLTGTVRLPEGSSNEYIIQILGTDRTMRVDTSTVAFHLSGMPADTYTLRVTQVSGGTESRDIEADVASGSEPTTVALDFRIPVLLVDGINWHHWKISTPRFISILEGSGLFKVTVSTTPPDSSPQALWDAWRPDFSAYKAVVVNYSSGYWDIHTANRWPPEVEEAFRGFVWNGGGAVFTHSTTSAFEGWDDQLDMIGLAWRDSTKEPGLFIDSAGTVTAIPVNVGPDPYTLDTTALIVTYDKQHPINQGLPDSWLHVEDEIDLGLRGPAENLNVLNYSFNSNSGLNHPVDWVVPYGSGRVYTNTLGHVWNTDSTMLCLGYQTMLIRGTEWAATGEVTYPVPATFPTDSTVVLRDQ